SGRIATRQPNEILIKVPIRLFERIGYLFCRPLGRGGVVRHGATVTTVPLEGRAGQAHHGGRCATDRESAPRLRGCYRGVRAQASTTMHFSGRSRKAGVVFLEPGDIRDGGEGVRLKKPERRR